MGPLLVYAALGFIVALYGRRIQHGISRLLALAFTFTPWLTFLYVLCLERELGRA